MSPGQATSVGRRGLTPRRMLHALRPVVSAAAGLTLLTTMATAPTRAPTEARAGLPAEVAASASVTRPDFVPAALAGGSFGMGDGAGSVAPPRTSDPAPDSDTGLTAEAAGVATAIAELAALLASRPGPFGSAPLAPPASTVASIQVPDVLWTAYGRAVTGVRPGCHLPVALLAAIGHIESRSLAGRSLTSDHDVLPPVLGPTLSGGEFAAIRDTDGGRWDGDSVWDRAVGPMQFIPGTWRVWGRDGNSDGVANPQNVEDAALSAATYLCAGRDLSDPVQLRAAVLSYNSSSSYAAAVLGLMASMASGGPALPGGVPVPVTVKATTTTTVTVTSSATSTVTATVTSTETASRTPNPPITVTQTVAVTVTATPTVTAPTVAMTASTSSACGATTETTGTPAPPSTTGC
ncbi:MAG: lytic murein transglycosylase [Dermatophilaceae bacterium]